VGSDLAQDGALGGQPVGFEGGVGQKVMFAFEIIRAVGLDIGVLLPENVEVFALDGLPLLLKNTRVIVENTFFSGAEQQVCFTGASRVGYQNFRGYDFAHSSTDLVSDPRIYRLELSIQSPSLLYGKCGGWGFGNQSLRGLRRRPGR